MLVDTPTQTKIALPVHLRLLVFRSPSSPPSLCIQAERDTKDEELGKLRCTSPAQLWTADLDNFLEQYDGYEQEEERKASNEGPRPKGKKVGSGVFARVEWQDSLAGCPIHARCVRFCVCLVFAHVLACVCCWRSISAGISRECAGCGEQGVSKAAMKKKAASKRRKSWGASDMSDSEDESDTFDDDEDSDEEFGAKKKKGKKPAAKQAAKRPRQDEPPVKIQWIPPPKAKVRKRRGAGLVE
jgi:hypothetical protein